MDIAALSTNVSQMKIANEISVSVMKMAMDMSSLQVEELSKALELSINPNVGSKVDLKI